jgi:hypothetical protein
MKFPFLTKHEKLDPAFAAVSHFHMGALCMFEQMAVTMLGHFARFAPSPRWRKISVFGCAAPLVVFP